MMTDDDSPLTPDEIKVLHDKGVEAAKGHEMSIALYPKGMLQDFVRGYLAGRVFTDRVVRPEMVGMVFMPLLFGAMQPQGDAEAALKAVQVETGEEPKLPEPPSEPELPAKPGPRKAKKPLGPNPARVRQIRSEMGKGWPLGAPDGSEPEDAMAAYLARIERLNQEREALSRAPDPGYEERVRSWATTCEFLKAEHAARRQEHEALCASLDERRALCARRTAENDAIRAGFMQRYASTLGCIWEDLSKAGPGAINGFPIFSSLHMMHRDDFKRAATAIERELARSKDIEV